MRSARFGSSDWAVRRRAVTVAALMLSVGRGPLSPRPTWAASADPVRLHASAGWGRPAVDGTTVYYLSKVHELFAVDRGTGRERWRRTLANDANLTAGIDVIAWRDLVIAGDGGVFAFDATTGNPRWRFAPEGDVPGRFIGGVIDGALLVGSTAGAVVALDLATGDVRWRTILRVGRVTVFAPVSTEDLVVATWTAFDEGPRFGGLVGLSVRDGTVRWRVSFPRSRALLAASAAGPPTITRDSTIVSAATDGTVYGLSTASGDVAWTLPPVPAALSGGEHEDVRAVASAPPLAVVTSLSGRLSAVDLADRREAWHYESPPDGSVGFALAIRGPWAFVPFASGRLLIIDWRTGREKRWLGGLARRFDWPPVPAPGSASGQMYVTGEDGLYVFEADLEG